MEEIQYLLQNKIPKIPYDSQIAKNIAKTYLNVFASVLDFSSISEVNNLQKPSWTKLQTNQLFIEKL